MVHKWCSLTMIFVISSLESKPVIPVQIYPVTVSIEPVKESCSNIALTFYVEQPEQVVTLPVGVVGLDGNGLLASSLHIRDAQSDEPVFQKSARQIGENISLSYEKSPYEVELDLKTTYGLMTGDFVLKFYHFDAPYETVVTDNGAILGLSQQVVSFSYFLSFDDKGCIAKFYTGF